MSDYSINKKIFSSSVKLLIIVFINLFLFISGGQAKSRTYPEAARYLDAYLSRLERFGFSGNVLFAHKDTIYFNKGYGLANIEKNIRNRPETMFQMDSMSKQFTATAILTLEMQGKLKVTDSITKFFEQVPPDKTEITLHHLLTHTSGVISGTTEYFEKNTKNDIIRIALESPLKFKPGESDLYSNIGYVLLATVVEKVSGMPFDEYLSQNLFTPAGMSHTRLRSSSWKENLLAYRYDENNKKHSPFINSYPDWNFIGGSGVLSTTKDLFLWHKALLGTSILSEEAKKKMFTPVANDYGYGWFIMKTRYGQVVRHGGGSSNGSASQFLRYLDKDVVIIISSNQDGESRIFGERLDSNIERIVFGESIELPPQVSTSSSQTNLDQFSGTYLNTDGSTINIISKKGFLEITGNGQSSVTGLLTKSETEAREYQKITDKTGKILQDMIKEDYSGLIAVAGAKSDSRYKRYAESFGKAESYNVFGTVPATGVENAKYMTIFQINYPKKAQIHRFYWSKEGKMIATGGEGIRQAVKVKAIPKTANQLLTYDITLAKSAIINLGRNTKGRVHQLIIGKNIFLVVEK
jgi:CubicO group peptidase (beta-lactamase class C family)